MLWAVSYCSMILTRTKEIQHHYLVMRLRFLQGVTHRISVISLHSIWNFFMVVRPFLLFYFLNMDYRSPGKFFSTPCNKLKQNCHSSVAMEKCATNHEKRKRNWKTTKTSPSRTRKKNLFGHNLRYLRLGLLIWPGVWLASWQAG